MDKITTALKPLVAQLKQTTVDRGTFSMAKKLLAKHCHGLIPETAVSLINESAATLGVVPNMDNVAFNSLKAALLLQDVGMVDGETGVIFVSGVAAAPNVRTLSEVAAGGRASRKPATAAVAEEIAAPRRGRKPAATAAVEETPAVAAPRRGRKPATVVEEAPAATVRRRKVEVEPVAEAPAKRVSTRSAKAVEEAAPVRRKPAAEAATTSARRKPAAEEATPARRRKVEAEPVAEAPAKRVSRTAKPAAEEAAPARRSAKVAAPAPKTAVKKKVAPVVEPDVSDFDIDEFVED